MRNGFIGFCLLLACGTCAAKPLPTVAANDNRTPAGVLRDGALNVQLELREGRWYPEKDDGPYRDVYAFAEAKHAPQASGPLIRVPEGTKIRATIRNALPVAAKVYGLHTHPGDSKDALTLAPGETRELEFLAGDRGAYLYWATTSDHTLLNREGPESELSGAFVVDAPGERPDDHIFVVDMWNDPETHQQIATFNGKSWPYTDRLMLDVAKTYRWRIINASADTHAMHLHGFYFKREGAGDGERYEQIPEDRRREVVTEPIDAGHVFDMSWTPDRAGNWLFHCHMMVHMMPPRVLYPKDDHSAGHEEHEHTAGMGGLVIGLTVRPDRNAPTLVAAKDSRKLQLEISENADKIPLYRVAVNDPKVVATPDPDQPPHLLGPPLVLTRGEETEIEVKNMTTSPTAIHWHGIELESYYDGVPGWTGSGGRLSPPVAPGSSFVARMAPPRAGTFIYHTHWHDRQQLLNGMYGPLIVLEPGQAFDPEHDKIFIVSIGDYAPFGEMMLINGSPGPIPVALKVGTRYRLRFINITVNDSDVRVKLASKQVPVEWKIVAQDGAELPQALQTLAPADVALPVGSTLDVEYQSDVEGYVEMQVASPGFQGLVMQPLDFVAAQ